MEIIQSFLSEHLLMLYLLVFATFLGIEIIGNVPSVLHTPLMSGANAISGVVIIGAIILIRQTDPSNYTILSMGGIAIICAMINVVGGFAVTGRMLDMFKKKKK
ncbi:MAG: NAD(P) transhydrogenase subunit alpha [Cyclobacteriaceae bacterium]